MSEKWDTFFLGMAQYVASASKDPSTQVGAVIVDPNQRVVSMGFNGFARGVDDAPERYENRELKYKMILHAERNALIFAQRDLAGCTIYTWPFMPCSACAAMVIQSGIKEVVTYESHNERWVEDFTISKLMFDEAGVILRYMK